jgi:hypothetical protein
LMTSTLSLVSNSTLAKSSRSVSTTRLREVDAIVTWGQKVILKAVVYLYFETSWVIIKMLSIALADEKVKTEFEGVRSQKRSQSLGRRREREG